MSDRFFLDTNIFVYSFDLSAAAKSQSAQQLIRKALTTQKGVISYEVVQEFFNVALRRFVQPMKAGDAQHYLSAVFRPLLGVHSSQVLYVEALHLHAHGGLSWYDALIVSAAIQTRRELLLRKIFNPVSGSDVSRLRIPSSESSEPAHRRAQAGKSQQGSLVGRPQR